MVTIQDIARVANVSAMTVSRVITGSAPQKVSEETRTRVLRIAKEMGYQPNITARALRSKSTFLFGLVVPSIDHSFTASIVEGIQEVAMSQDYSCLLYITRGLPELESRSFDALLAKKADGIIWVPSQHVSSRVIDLKKNVPILQLLNKEITDLPAVLVDQVQGQYLASSYLVQLGHQQIGYIMKNDRHSRERLIGHQKALLEAGIPYDYAKVLKLDGEWSKRISGIQSFLHQLPNLTAIAASSDMTAWGTMQVAQQLNRQVPTQLSVTGFDNIELATQISPQLTTVDQPKRELGIAAMQTLARYIKGEKVEDIIMQPKLIKRGTTAPVKEVTAD